MPIAALIGLLVFALEVAGLAWLLNWLLAGSEHWILIGGGALFALALTAIALAAVVVADRADGEDDGIAAQTGPVHRSIDRSGSGITSEGARSLVSAVPLISGNAPKLDLPLTIYGSGKVSTGR